MYYVCRYYIDFIRQIKFDVRNVGGKEVRFLDKWQEKSKILNKLANVKPIRKKAKELYECIPTVYRDSDKFDVQDSIIKSFEKSKSELLACMETIINLYKATTYRNELDEKCGIDIMLPNFRDLGEFSDCLKDLNFVITQCPYFLRKDEEIKFKTIDIGSIWITLAVIGASSAILFNFGKIVDQAAKIKSHMSTVKMQEEMLRSMKTKNEVSEEVFDVFKKTKDVLLQQSLETIKNELGDLKDGEEIDKVKRSLEKLGYWMDKGMQIYSSIDAPKEVRDAFPEQQELSFLSDNLQKLLEMKNDSV